MRIVRIIEPGLLPELTGDLHGIDARRRPPGLLVAGAMNRAMMRAAERDGEFIAGFAAERTRLHESQVVRIRRFARTQEARLPGDKSKVLFVAVAPGRLTLSTLLSIRLDGLAVALSCVPIS